MRLILRRPVPWSDTHWSPANRLTVSY